MTTLPLIAILTRDEINRLQRERMALLPRQIGRPANRRRITELTHAQLREQVKL
jgi:hypothetical protein